MKIHLAWMRFAAAAVIATFGGEFAVGQSQYAPSTAIQPYVAQPDASVAPYGVQPTPSQAMPVYPTTPYPLVADKPTYANTQREASKASLPRQDRYAVTAPALAAPPQYQPPQYQPPVAQRSAGSSALGMRTAMNYSAEPQQVETLPKPNGNAISPSFPPGNSMAAPYPASGDGTAGYFASDPGYSAGGNGVYGCESCGVDGYLPNGKSGARWFGGVYGLVMARDNPSGEQLSVLIDESSTTFPVFPSQGTTVLWTNSNDFDYQGGAEIRIGAVFSTGGSYDDTCGSYCRQQDYAWEAVYWWLDDDPDLYQYNVPLVDPDLRLHSLRNFSGLEYDPDGAAGPSGFVPMNVFYDYQLPINQPAAPVAGDIRVQDQSIRTNFSAQNLELNLLRLPMFTACGTGCDGDTCSTCEPSLTIVGLCGFRYLRIDDDFGFGSWYSEFDGTNWVEGSDMLSYDINVDNHLVGFQLGANMGYRVASRWSVFWDTSFGIYNNYIESQQSVHGNGDVRFIATGADGTLSSNKDDLAFLGEMRLGTAYDISANVRGVLAYRAIGITGVALSTEQLADDFSSSAAVQRIDSDGSLVIHGAQAGVEWRY